VTKETLKIEFILILTTICNFRHPKIISTNKNAAKAKDAAVLSR
jgi:hypothetical protein